MQSVTNSLPLGCCLVLSRWRPSSVTCCRCLATAVRCWSRQSHCRSRGLSQAGPSADNSDTVKETSKPKPGGSGWAVSVRRRLLAVDSNNLLLNVAMVLLALPLALELTRLLWLNWLVVRARRLVQQDERTAPFLGVSEPWDEVSMCSYGQGVYSYLTGKERGFWPWPFDRDSPVDTGSPRWPGFQLSVSTERHQALICFNLKQNTFDEFEYLYVDIDGRRIVLKESSTESSGV